MYRIKIEFFDIANKESRYVEEVQQQDVFMQVVADIDLIKIIDAINSTSK